MIYKENIINFKEIKSHSYETYTANCGRYVLFCETYKRVSGNPIGDRSTI